MLTDREGFAVSLRLLAGMHSKALTAADVDGFWTALHGRLTDQQFTAACEKLHVGQWFPTPARILAAIPRRTPDLEVAAVRLYQEVRKCQDWDAEVGTVFRENAVAHRCGSFAAQVFMVAGGPDAFRSAIVDETQEPWVRKAFVAAYWAVLDAPIDAPLLPSGEASPMVRALAEKLSAP